MSINSALLAGVSGLVANSSALAAISDNIANVNTTAYKRNQVDFSTMVTSQAVAGRYSAGGVQGITRQFVSQQGLIQSASSATDLAISGDGFFVVTTKGAGLTASDPREFTRAGAFEPDANGYLVNDAGLYLQGWPVQANGTFDTDPSDLSKIQPINVKNLGAAVQQTGQVAISANLDQTTPVGAGAATYDNTLQSMATYAATAGASGTAPDAPPIELSVIDSMGGSHKFSVAFEKTGTPNTWNAEIYAVPATDVTSLPAGQVAAGQVKFNTDGSIDLANSTLFGAAGAPATITMGASGGAQPAWATARHRRSDAEPQPEPADPDRLALDGGLGQRQRRQRRQHHRCPGGHGWRGLGGVRQQPGAQDRPGGHRHLPELGRAVSRQRQRLHKRAHGRHHDLEDGRDRRRGQDRALQP